MNFIKHTIKSIINQIEQKRNIRKVILIKALKNVLISVVKKNKSDLILDIQYSRKKGVINLYSLKKIVKKVEKPNVEISKKYIKVLDIYTQNATLGELFKIPININKLGRTIAKNAKDIILKKIIDAEKSIMYINYNKSRNKLVTGIVKRLEKGNVILNIGKIKGVLQYKEQIPEEYIRAGDFLSAYVMDVVNTSTGLQILLSRCHKNFVLKLFEQEIPEISGGIIKIYNITRKAGVKTKILIHAHANIDIIGVCFGLKKIRIKSISKELKNEKVEIIPYDKSIARLACNAIGSTEIIYVLVKKNKRLLKIVVPDEQLSLAIGHNGINIILAMNLINWKIDIRSIINVIYDKYSINKKLCVVKNICDVQIKSLHNNDVRVLDDISNICDKKILLIFGIEQKELYVLKKQINFLLFNSKVDCNKDIITSKKQVYNLTLIFDHVKLSKFSLPLYYINFPLSLKHSFYKCGYDICSIYFEDTFFLEILFKINFKIAVKIKNIARTIVSDMVFSKIL
jgi:N utilization substance protein A